MGCARKEVPRARYEPELQQRSRNSKTNSSLRDRAEACAARLEEVCFGVWVLARVSSCTLSWRCVPCDHHARISGHLLLLSCQDSSYRLVCDI